MSDLYSYDSFAKLNIMTEAKKEGQPTIPQIMFDLSTGGTKRTWKGDRLAITYNSGNSASYFRISEVTGSYRNKLNFELIGSNNIFYGTVKGTSNNSFVFSRDNTISDYSFDNNWINSDGNQIIAPSTSGINFIDSNNNTLLSGWLYHRFSSAANISFYHSNSNRILPEFKYIYQTKGIKGDYQSYPLYNNQGNVTGYALVSSYDPSKNLVIKGIKGGVIRNKTLINSDNNRFFGHDDFDNKSVFINSNNGFYFNDFGTKNTVSIGNDWGFIQNVSGNTITIGRGLMNLNTTADKIILGQFNRNSTNDKDVLIVGDGRLSQNYFNYLTAANPNWETDDIQYKNILSGLSAVGSPSSDSGIYRHNIFTVNKDGYITISDWSKPSNSARYGYNGITAYNDGNVYTIPYNTLYNKINVGDAITQMQETVDSYTKQIKDISDTVPTNYFYCPPANVTAIYLNEPEPQTIIPSDVKYIWKDISANVANNTILSISFTGASNSNLLVNWTNNGGSSTAKINSYCSKQFLFVTNSGTEQNVSGFLLIND